MFHAPRRPALGQEGRPIALRANHLEVRIVLTAYYIYPRVFAWHDMQNWSIIVIISSIDLIVTKQKWLYGQWSNLFVPIIREHFLLHIFERVSHRVVIKNSTLTCNINVRASLIIMYYVIWTTMAKKVTYKVYDRSFY